MKTDRYGGQPPERGRKSLRLPGFDYTQPGAYFVTLVTHDRACLFGAIAEGMMHLTAFGQIAQDEWLRTGSLRGGMTLSEDEFVVMLNHIHGIVCLAEAGARRRRAPTQESFACPVAGSLGTIVRAYKSAVTYRINQLRGTRRYPVRQRGYHERVVRSEEALGRLCIYIKENPMHWELYHAI